jgi:chromosome partitioning protein
MTGMTYTIAVANQKGGVAKTTTTLSLGGALARTGLDVLLVDLDPQANLTLALGSEAGRQPGAIADVFLREASISSISRPSPVAGLDFVPSVVEMENAEQMLPLRQSYEYVLKNSLQDHLPYDVILVDCPPAVGALTTNALIAADLLIIPTQPEYFSAFALRHMMGVIRTVRARGNPALIYRILITMRDLRNRIHRSLCEQLKTTFGDGLFETVIDVDTKLRESAVAGLPITSYAQHSRSALQYSALALELSEHVQKKVNQPA